MSTRIANKESKRAQGEAAIAAGTSQAKRADHLPTFAEMTRMMHCALSGDANVNRDPLCALQTGAEVRITHTTGVRGQILRTAKFGHLSPTRQEAIPWLIGTQLFNTSGDKTHLPGEGFHTGWMPSRNALFCPDGLIGTCLLYRVCVKEAFPNVVDDNGNAYKQLPLIISSASRAASSRRSSRPTCASSAASATRRPR